MTPADYHSPENQRAYLSASQLRGFYSCEARAMNELNNPAKDSLDDKKDVAIGNYVDAALLTPENLDAVVRRHSEVFLLAKGGDAAPLIVAKRMADRAKGEPQFMAILSGKHQHILEFEIEGINARAMLDVCDPDSGKIVDVKTAPEVHEDGIVWSPFRAKWYDSYHAQLAIYAEAYRQNYSESPWMLYLAGISKQDPPQLALVDFSGQKGRLAFELKRIRQYAPRVHALKNGKANALRCERCAFCRAAGVLEYDVCNDNE